MVHGCMVYTERAETATVSRGTRDVTSKRCLSTPLERLVKTHYAKLQSLIQNRIRQERSCKVYTERAETAAVPRGTSHVTTKQRCKYTTSAEIWNALLKATVTHLESHATRALCVCSRERRIACIKAINNMSLIQVSRFGLVVKALGW